MIISHIVASSRNNVIGLNNTMPWSLSADLKHFSTLTSGHDVIVGRKTFESILTAIGKPLPNRRMIVITHNTDYNVPDNCCVVVSSVDKALETAEGKEVFIAGGSEIYKQTLDKADRIYLTRVEADVDGDTFYPKLDERQWKLVSNEYHDADEENEHPFTFQTYERIRKRQSLR